MKNHDTGSNHHKKSKSKHKDKKHHRKSRSSGESKKLKPNTYDDFDINPREQIIDLLLSLQKKDEKPQTESELKKDKKKSSKRKRDESSDSDRNSSSKKAKKKELVDLPGELIPFKARSREKSSEKHKKSKKSKKDSKKSSDKKSKKSKRKKSPNREKKSKKSSRKRSTSRSSDSDFSPAKKPTEKPKARSRSSSRSSDSEFEAPVKPSQKPSRWDQPPKSLIPVKEAVHEKKDEKKKKTMEGTTAGLQNLQSLREEIEAQKRREAKALKNMSHDVSGAGQATIVRDRKSGRRRNFEEEAEEKLRKRKEQEEIEEKYARWGKGLKQVEDRNDQLKADLHEMNKPLARYADDEDLDKHLREKELMEDPMLNYMRQKQSKDGKRPALISNPNQNAYIPNRFNIKPGLRWDGVDRSNGYEKKWFEAKNTKKAQEDEAFKWCTADM